MQVSFCLVDFAYLIGIILQGLSYDMWALILWRALTGLFAGSMIIAQSYVDGMSL